MTDEEKIKAFEILLDAAFSLRLNFNDTFYYACADAGELDTSDATDLLPFIAEYGFDALVAYEAIKRGHDPTIKPYASERFKAVKLRLLEGMSRDPDFLSELNYTKKKESEQIIKYGGTLTFKFKQPSLWKRIMRQKYYTCICTCTGTKIRGFGSNMMEAEADLTKRMGV